MTCSRIVFAALALAAASGLWAGSLDGRWTGGVKMQRKGGEKTVAMTLDLMTEGGALKGKVALGKRSVEIQDGTVDGDRFSFTTVAKGKKGDRKIQWRGSLKGETLEVSRGGKKKRGEPAVLKRG